MANAITPHLATLLKSITLLGVFVAMGIHVTSIVTRFWWTLDYPAMYNDATGIRTIHGGLWHVCTEYLESYDRDMLCRDYDSRIAIMAQIPPMSDWIQNVEASRVMGIFSCTLFFVSGLLIGCSFFLKVYKKPVLFLAAMVLMFQALLEVGAIAVMHHWLRADLNFIEYGQSFLCACGACATYGMLSLLSIVTACMESMPDDKKLPDDMELGDYSPQGRDF